MLIRFRAAIAWLIVAVLVVIQCLNSVSNPDMAFFYEPIVTDNLDGNYTARWELKNPDNFTLTNIELIDGQAALFLDKVTFIEDSISEFRNGSWENIKLIGNQGIGLDLRRNSYTLIADCNNHRAVEIDYDKWFWQYGTNATSGYTLNKLEKPTFAIRISENNTLITDTDNSRVIEVGRNSEFYWQYGSNTTTGIGDNLLKYPSSAVPMSNGNILIADTGNCYVVEVNRNKEWVWQYGYPTDNPSQWTDPSVSELHMPTFAQELPNGNILIADQSNHRVIEVIKNTKTVVWQYGIGSPGVGVGALDSPTFAARVNGGSSGGNTLISDTKNHRVIEVDPSGKILWQYGKNGTSGYGVGKLNLPTCAVRLPNGNTLITDSANHRVLEINNLNNIVWQYGTNGSTGHGLNKLDSPKSALPIPKSYLIGYFVSQVLDGGKVTNWTEISWDSIAPQNTYILTFTRTGDAPKESQGTWSAWSREYVNATGENITSPDNRYIQYCAVLFTFDLTRTPVLQSIRINGTRYELQGELTTEFFQPSGLLQWNRLIVNGQHNGQLIESYYQTKNSAFWFRVPVGGKLKNVPIDSGKIRFRFVLTTSDISRSPIIENFSLIYEALGELNYIKVIPEYMDVMVGDKFEFNAVGFDLYNRELEIDPEWSTTIGKMEQNMFFAQTVVGSGYVNASIGSEDGGSTEVYTGSARVNVTPGPLEYILVKPSDITVIAGEKYEFQAWGYDKFDNEISIEPEWGTDVGKMEDNIFYAQAFAGRGTVKAKVDDITGYANVIVELNSSKHHPPRILERIPDQVRKEDSEPWSIQLAPFEWDEEDTGEKLLWYLTDYNESLYSVTGGYSKEDELTFILKPNAFGSDKATLWLVDSDNMTASQTLWVNITPVNDKPIIEKLPDISVHFDEPYTFDYSSYIHDIETADEDLILSILEPDKHQYTNVKGMEVTFNYPKEMFGEVVTLTLMVSDGNEFASELFKVSITDNHAPELIKPFPDIILSEGENKPNAFDLDEHFTDSDGDSLTYFFNAQNIAVNVHGDNSVSISSTSSWFGTEIITFRAMDPFGAMAEGNAVVTVLGVNNPPMILPIPDIYVHYDFDYKFNISNYITDLDNSTNELTIWTSDPENIRFDKSDNTLMILNYPEDQIGQIQYVILNVTDGIDMVWTQFRVYVTDNYPPILKKDMVDIYFKEDEGLNNAINLLEYFTDYDDDELEFTYNLIDEENITLILNPDYSIDLSSKQDWYGSSNIFFKAEDGKKAFIETSISIIVIPVNDAPNIEPIPNQTGKVGERWVIDLTSYLDDVDNNISELEILIENDLILVTGRQLTIYGDKPIDTDVEFIISDGSQNTTGSFHLQIADVKHPRSEGFSDLIWLLVLIIISILILVVFSVIRKRRGNFIITDVFIIHKGGILIKYLGDTLKTDSDEDIISGMLTAVQSFISDSFAGGADEEVDAWSLNQLKMGRHEIMIERGKNIFITVIYKGNPGRRLAKVLKQTIKLVEAKFGKKLAEWKGNYGQLKGIEELVKPLITSKKPSKKSGEKMQDEPTEFTMPQPPSQTQPVTANLSTTQNAQALPAPTPPTTQYTAQLPPHQMSSPQSSIQPSQQLPKKFPKKYPKNSSNQTTQQYLSYLPSHLNAQPHFVSKHGENVQNHTCIKK